MSVPFLEFIIFMDLRAKRRKVIIAPGIILAGSQLP